MRTNGQEIAGVEVLHPNFVHNNGMEPKLAIANVVSRGMLLGALADPQIVEDPCRLVQAHRFAQLGPQVDPIEVQKPIQHVVALLLPVVAPLLAVPVQLPVLTRAGSPISQTPLQLTVSTQRDRTEAETYLVGIGRLVVPLLLLQRISQTQCLLVKRAKRL